MLCWSHALRFNCLWGEVENASLVLHSLALRLRDLSLLVNQWRTIKAAVISWCHGCSSGVTQDHILFRITIGNAGWNGIMNHRKKRGIRFNAHLQTAYSVITYAFPFFPFSCCLLFTYTISEHIQKKTDISLSLKICIASYNVSKANIFLLMHIEFLFHLVSPSHFKM